MAALNVRDMSEETLTTLKVRAARAGQSLQSYVRHVLDEEAEMLTADEAADEARSIAERSAVSAEDVVNTVDELRRARQ